MKRIIILILTILTFMSCDPAQTINIINDTEFIHSFDFEDPNIVGSDRIIIDANNQDTFSKIGLFLGKSISEMKETLGKIRITKITENGNFIIAEGSDAQTLLSKSLVREDNSWKIYCRSFK